MKIRLFTAALFVLISIPSGAFNPEPTIRVEVFEGGPSVTLSAENGGLLNIEGDKGSVKTASAVLNSSTNGIKVNGRSLGRQITINSKISLIKIADRMFRGDIRITSYNNRLAAINSVPLESYITGLINSEISSSWPDEAIKAQAVAARTYALNQMERIRKNRPDAPYDIQSTIMDQVYDGAHKEDERSKTIVGPTRGIVLKKNGVLFPAFYHSCCGGMTEHAHNVWAGAEGPPQIEDRFCERSPKKSWTYEISKQELAQILSKNGYSTDTIISATIMPLFDSPRVDTVLIETSGITHNVRATELRRLMGYTNIKSTWFEVKMDGNKTVFSGRGYGHGVGMCQWGSKGMAEEGYSYAEILKFYYPDAELITIY